MLISLLQNNNIELLTHPILEYEIRKHIKESSLIKRPKDLQNLIKQCANQLTLIDLCANELAENIGKLNMDKRLFDAFENTYAQATVLPYAAPESVFEDYFKCNPPFSASGKKKSEFPDAFILKGLLEYCKTNESATVLVISSDSDWADVIKPHPQLMLVESFEAAMAKLWHQIDDKTELFEALIEHVSEKLKDDISTNALYEAFCIKSVDEAEDVEITNVEVYDIDEDIIPLSVSNDSVLLQVRAMLSVDGTANYFDSDRSVWDSEDKQYYFLAYNRIEFKKAVAEIDCEIGINFSESDWPGSINLSTVRLINKWDISVDISNADVTEYDITDYDMEDYLAEQAEALEEFYKH